MPTDLHSPAFNRVDKTASQQDNAPSSVPAPKQVHRFSWTRFHWLSHTSSVAYRLCLSSFQARYATSRHRDFHSRKFPLVTLCRESDFANHFHAPALLVLVRRSLCYPALRALISTAFSQIKKWLSLLEIATFSFMLIFFLNRRKIKALYFRLFIIAPLDAPPRRMLFPLFFRKGSRSL